MTGPAMSPRKKTQAYELVVREVVRETHDTVTLVLAPPAGVSLEYKAGQYCTIDARQFPALASLVAYLEHAKGRREVPRAYSLTSAPHEAHLAITIKEEPFLPGVTRYPPLLSPLLVHATPAGARLTVAGFTGPYTLPDDVESRTDHIVHVVAGTGVVPNFSILKDALARGLKLRHTFIYSNKTYGDICFRRELEALEKEHPDKLKVVHTLTREEDPARFGRNIRRGRVSLELFAELVTDPQTCLAYVCGPAILPWERAAAKERGTAPTPRFLETVISNLVELGVAGVRIKRESYG